ncbi:DUF4435 domain-containing protein [Paenibacillus sp. CC-CFT742]|nr:DUF4435 domain-containing protein [Paenibacillus sp. CC-CFT742]WJH27090.1 DUF4435 domain-containing protein [Paenibacillus sp. CC-CFT742]
MNKDNDYADKLRDKRARYVVAYKKFTTMISTMKDDLFCFVEGHDDSLYYGPHIINMYKGHRYQFLNCSGKEGVLSAARLICSSSEYSSAKVFFFVDSDFDVDMVSDSIYTTPCYSIENLYTSSDVFEQILKCEFQLTDADNDFQTMMDIFKERQKEFHDAALLMNCWIYCQKEIGNKLNIDDTIRPETFYRFINIKVDKVEQRYQVEDLENKFSGVPIIDSEVLECKIREFDFNRGRKFRGKFELLFLKKILEQISADANKKRPDLFEERRKNTISLTGNLLSIFSRYAEVPDCLIRYLSKYIPEGQKEQSLLQTTTV